MKRLEHDDLERLLDALKAEGYTLVGPRLQDQAIVYDHIEGAGDLPAGWTDEQDKGVYRVKKRNDNAVFGYVIGPMSWKKFLFPPRMRLWGAEGERGRFSVKPEERDIPAYAFIGVRSCDLHAILIQDKVFMQGPYPDPVYKERREKAFIVAVNCVEAAKTCFCVSMGTGPKVKDAFDLALTEVCTKDRHYFVLTSGSKKGEAVLNRLSLEDAGENEVNSARAAEENAVSQISRTLSTQGLKETLYGNFEHPRWEEVASRCLSCANCTMVCPTCFCSTVEDVSDITGEHAERWRLWDSCFNLEYSYIHGGHTRTSVKSRYRQWMTHKLASWQDQFDVSGCVGCGRCISWCPVGIDITEEARVIQDG